MFFETKSIIIGFFKHFQQIRRQLQACPRSVVSKPRLALIQYRARFLRKSEGAQKGGLGRRIPPRLYETMFFLPIIVSCRSGIIFFFLLAYYPTDIINSTILRTSYAEKKKNVYIVWAEVESNNDHRLFKLFYFNIFS